jgi:O-succinylbenzoate synthase
MISANIKPKEYIKKLLEELEDDSVRTYDVTIDENRRDGKIVDICLRAIEVTNIE